MPKPEGIVSPREKISSKKLKHRLARWEYVTLNAGGGVEECSCKMCGTVIFGKRPIGDPMVVQRSQDKRTVLMEQHIERAPLWNYQLVIFEFEDGSIHMTPLCSTCAKRPDLKDFMEDLYLADLDQTDKENVALDPARADGWLALVGGKIPKSCRQAGAEET